MVYGFTVIYNLRLLQYDYCLGTLLSGYLFPQESSLGIVQQRMELSCLSYNGSIRYLHRNLPFPIDQFILVSSIE